MITNKRNRTTQYFKQLKLTLVFKILAIASSFLIIPLLINYLGIESYGIWSTVLTVLMWIVYFDLGLGNGLRNKVTIALAENNYTEAREYITTAYISIGIFGFMIYTLFIFMSNFIDFSFLFNTKNISHDILKYTSLTILFAILVNFTLILGIQIYYALHKSEVSVIHQFLYNSLVLLGISILITFFPTNLLYVSIIYGLAMLLAIIIINIILFKEHPYLKPAINSFNSKKIKSLLSLSLKFFIIQSSLLVILSTDKIIITHLFGPTEVTSYDVIYKLFTFLLVIQNIILAPLWSSFTDAYEKNDYNWISKTLKTLLLLMIPFLLSSIALYFFAPSIIEVWIQTKLNYSDSLVGLMALFIILMIWNNIYANFANGTSKVNIQLYSYLIGSLINIPLSIIFSKYIFYGLEGVIAASIVSIFIFSILGPIHTKIILNKMRNNVHI